jgi:hypothetical protein
MGDSSANQDENSIFNDDVSGQSEDTDEIVQNWGTSSVMNEVVIPDRTVLAAVLGLPLEFLLPPVSPALQPLPLQPPQLLPAQEEGEIRVVIPSRRRPRDELLEQPKKLFKDQQGKKTIKKFADHNYLRLTSGVEFIFNDTDGKALLLNETTEPSRLIRNIISRIPSGVSQRLRFLTQFKFDEESDSSSDSGESKYDDNDVDRKSKRRIQERYFGKLQDRVFEGFIREFRLRHIFKKVLIYWRTYKMNKSCEKELDPITLAPPEKEIVVYDWANRKKNIFDAKSLATLIETQLMYQEHGFPLPIYPRNPKNNLNFTYGQLIKIYNQLKDAGELRWGFTTLREYNFNKHRWQMFHKAALTINAIKISITLLDTFEAKDLFSDFIFAKMDELGIRHNNYTYNTYQVAMALVPKHWYLEKLKPLAILHYESQHFDYNKNKLINAACSKIFKKQHLFIKDLQNKKII